MSTSPESTTAPQTGTLQGALSILAIVAGGYTWALLYTLHQPLLGAVVFIVAALILIFTMRKQSASRLWIPAVLLLALIAAPVALQLAA